MFTECVTKRFRQDNWDGIPNLPSHGIQTSSESEVWRKCLQACSFTNTNGSVLGRVTEPSIGEADASRRQRTREHITTHPPIYVSVATVLVIVTLEA
jgi:hypothetical protein